MFGGILIILLGFCVLIGNHFAVILMAIGMFYEMYRGWLCLERKWSRYRALENAMSKIYSIKYMYSTEAKRFQLDMAKDYFVCAIEDGYKPEKDDRWQLVKQYMDEIERIDETSAD